MTRPGPRLGSGRGPVDRGGGGERHLAVAAGRGGQRAGAAVLRRRWWRGGWRGSRCSTCWGAGPSAELDLLVDRPVLIPRPETEQVVEVALAELGPAGRRARAGPGAAGRCVVDLGTGSGAIALSLAAEGRPGAVWATDVSPEALAVARANLVGLGGSGGHGPPGRGVVVGRPAARAAGPGVAGRLQPAVCVDRRDGRRSPRWWPSGSRRWPCTAAPTGSTPSRSSCRSARLAGPAGTLVVELAPHQAAAAEALAQRAGFDESSRLDLAGRERAWSAAVDRLADGSPSKPCRPSRVTGRSVGPGRWLAVGADIVERVAIIDARGDPPPRGHRRGRRSSRRWHRRVYRPTRCTGWRPTRSGPAPRTGCSRSSGGPARSSSRCWWPTWTRRWHWPSPVPAAGRRAADGPVLARPAHRRAAPPARPQRRPRQRRRHHRRPLPQPSGAVWPCAGRWARSPPPAPTATARPRRRRHRSWPRRSGRASKLVLDGGPCTGSPSTVVDCTGAEPHLLREGRLSWDEVLRVATGTDQLDS